MSKRNTCLCAVCLAVTLMTGSGCATQSWVQKELASSKAALLRDVDTQTNSYVQRIQTEKEQNEELLLLADNLDSEISKLKLSLNKLTAELDALKKHMVTSIKTKGNDVKSTVQEENSEARSKIRQHFNSQIEQLRKEMATVELAGDRAEKLTATLKRMLDVYSEASKSIKQE